MSVLIADSYDRYAGQADMTTGNQWTTSSGSFGCILSTTTRFAVGRSICINSGQWLQKTGSSNQATWYLHNSRIQKAALQGSFSTGDYFTLIDGTTAQCTVAFGYDGSIHFLRGDPSGTLLATYSGAFVANSFDSFQFEIVINSTTGAIHIRKNGAGSDSFSATGLNTQATANAYAQSVQVGAFGTVLGGGNYFNDDLIVIYDDGVAPNTWTGDVRAIQLQPTLDTAQKQFTQNSSGSLAFNWANAGSSTENLSANVLYIGCTGDQGSGSVATQGGLLTSATVTFNAGFTGHAKLAVYLMDGDTQDLRSETYAGTLVGVSDQVTNPSATQAFTFSTNAPIKKGFHYAYGLLTDAAFVSKSDGGIGDRGCTYTAGISYGGGFPASLIGVPPATTNDAHMGAITATLTANNAGCVNDEAEDGSTTFLSDANVGDFDLYDLEDLGYTPSAILGINLCSYVAKSDAGGRGFKISGKSGATSFDSGEYFPLTTYSNFSEFRATDPNTSAAWTTGAVDALEIGPKVSS